MDNDRFGPNTEAIEAIIERLKTMTVDEAEALGSAWNSAWNSARVAARDAARDAAWNSARYAAWDSVWDAAWDAARDLVWDAAWDAAWDAILALLVRDKITPEQFDILYGPWKQVMEVRS